MSQVQPPEPPEIEAPSDVPRRAVLWREATPDHLCPWGLRSRDLLRRQGFRVEDHLLRSRDEVEAFMAEHGVEATPQTFIEGDRIGGYEELRHHLGLEVNDPDAENYAPVIAVYAGAAVLALAWYFAVPGAGAVQLVIWFVALSMALLAVQKLRDLDAFVTRFLGYDLLAQRWVPYAHVYAFAELGAGAGMIVPALRPLAAIVALFIGGVGAASVFKAAYVDKRELKCACVGGAGNVPLGPVSLTENLMMGVMGLLVLLF